MPAGLSPGPCDGVASCHGVDCTFEYKRPDVCRPQNGRRSSARRHNSAGYGLTREQSCDIETIQQPEGRWVLAHLEGKSRRIRTVAIPSGQAGNQRLNSRPGSKIAVCCGWF
jgi:hypothetical protein